jgi:hypothetical protein
MTPDERALLDRLRTLIGRDCRYDGRRCRIVEVLAEADSAAPGGPPPAATRAPGPPIGRLILEAPEDTPPIQADQYGHAAYRANDLIEVPIHGDGVLSDDLLRLLEGLRD